MTPQAHQALYTLATCIPYLHPTLVALFLTLLLKTEWKSFFLDNLEPYQSAEDQLQSAYHDETRHQPQKRNRT